MKKILLSALLLVGAGCEPMPPCVKQTITIHHEAESHWVKNYWGFPEKITTPPYDTHEEVCG